MLGYQQQTINRLVRMLANDGVQTDIKRFRLAEEIPDKPFVSN